MKFKEKKFIYKNLLIYSSLQFCGNIEEYFSENSESLLAFIVMPRVKNKFNLLRVYKEGKLISEKKLISSSNIFLYYLLWYTDYLLILFIYANKKEKLKILGSHPITFFGMNIFKIVFNVSFAYYVCDYFPPINLSLSLFEKLKKYYHDRVKYSCYLSDRINEKMNGQIINTFYRKTIMWGVKPEKIIRNLPEKSFSFLFVGLIKESQGLEFFYDFLKKHKQYTIKIIGICEANLYEKYKKIIKEYGIEKQVYFPNRFFSNEELKEISRTCHVAIALYKTGKLNATYYTDPGKIKAYTELGLPVLMSDISAISGYIKKFNAGEIVELTNDSIYQGVNKIVSNYRKYVNGIEKFNKFFYYKTYYKKRYIFLEDN